MDFISWILLGGVAGWIATMVTGHSGGIFRTIIIGVIGAVIGGWLFQQFGAAGLGDAGWLWNLLVAVVGAMVLITVGRFILHPKRT
jgi:uncharacterized membrane protein YeaQ/YmgE (transglycosylase-associated protein family)